MNRPLVSAIMPVYNGVNYIAAAIESIQKQTLQNWELIVVDDGSTDGTGEVVAAFDDKRISYFHMAENKGRGIARSKAINLAKGEFIAICDADDISLPDRFRLQVNFLGRHPDIAAVSGQILHFTDGNLPWRHIHFPVEKEAISEMFKRGQMALAHCACMIRTTVFAVEHYDTAFSFIEDLELFIRLNARYAMANLDDVLVHYRNNHMQSPKLAAIQHFTLHHYYTVYVAHSKLAGTPFLSFPEWKRSLRWSPKFWLKSWISYLKLNIKLALVR